MNKKKSTAWLVIVTILLAVVCAISFLSFPIPGTVKEFKSVLSNIGLGTDLGGSYYTVYYPEGVLSKEDYEVRLEQTDSDKKDKFISSYEEHGSVYIEVDKMGNTFNEKFEKAVESITYRFDKLGIAGYTVAVRDDYTIYVSLPVSTSGAETIFENFAYDGTFSLGSAAGQADLGETRYHPLTEYFKHAEAKTRDHTPFVQIGMTETGRNEVYTLSNTIVADSINTLYFNIGSHSVISMSIDEAITSKDYIYVSGYKTIEEARAVAVVMDSAINGRGFDLPMTVGTVYEQEATNSYAKIILLASLAVCYVAMTLFFIIRNRGIGAAHFYSTLTYVLVMIIFLACMPGVFVTYSTIGAAVLGLLMLCCTNAIVIKTVKSEFELGKTITASMKVGYSKTMYASIEAHVVTIVGALLAAFIGVMELQMFGIVLAFGALLSGVCSILLMRFYWTIMMKQAKNAFKFSNWKREDDDDED